MVLWSCSRSNLWTAAAVPMLRAMEHTAYLDTIRDETQRFLEALATVPGDGPVPTCEGWTVDDLAWHLAEVQHFWAEVVSTGKDGDDVVAPARPGDSAGLAELGARSGTGLLTALASRTPQDRCWSWHEDGGSVGWVARRQAHEVLVHRVDAELAAGRAVTPPSAELAADGVDEVLRVMVDGVPGWGTFTPDGLTVRVVCSNAPAAWVLALGRFTGTGPDSGTEYDLDAAALLQEDGGGVDALTLEGPAWDLDRWLWGRGDLAGVAVSGDVALVERLRALVADATQ